MKKKVSVFCGSAFNIGPASFAGAVENVILDVNDINVCLMNKAKVVEILEDGSKVKLDFRNYNTNNGSSSVKDNDLSITDKNNHYRPTITTVDSKVDVVKEVKVSTTVVEETKVEEAVVKEEKEATTEETTIANEETTTDETKTESTFNNNNGGNNNNKYNKFKKSKA